MIAIIIATIASLLAPVSQSESAPERTISIDLDYSCRGAVGNITFTGGPAVITATSYVVGEDPEADAWTANVLEGTYEAGTAPYPSGTVITAWATAVYPDGEAVTTALTQGEIPAGC